MGEVKQINIKNRTYYFYNDIINLENFKSNLLKIDKKSYKNIGIYNIGYITINKIDDYEGIYSVNPLYLQVMQMDISKKKMEMNIQFLMILLMKTKSYLKNTQMIGMELKTKSKK